MKGFEQETTEIAAWMGGSRFDGIVRLHTPYQVLEQRGAIPAEYRVAKTAAEAFYARLRELFAAKRSITTFGPYSPGQAVVMKRLGIEGIYLGGWATSAKGSINEDPGADLASYPLNQVPDEASAIVRALLTADRNQHFARMRMSREQLAEAREVDFKPFIIADADTGHGGDAHVRNLIRRFVEVGVPGYHIEDQKPGVKKCGHQGGKVLVAQNEQIQRLNAARLQLDVMGVPGIIVARTDAEAATLLESNTEPTDQQFILGATSADVPSYKAVVVSVHRRFFELGVTEIRGHLMFNLPDADYASVLAWLTQAGLASLIDEKAAGFRQQTETNADSILDAVMSRVLDRWQADADLKTYREAVADTIAARTGGGENVGVTADEWLRVSKGLSLSLAREKAASFGLDVVWDCELARTPEGYYQVRGGLDYAIAKSLTAAPFADILWMETNTANLAEAEAYADAIHAEFPEKMLAYNLSPSFNWDTTGMTEEEMRNFPAELGKRGFVFNFITYGGHQIDGLASEEFTAALLQDGMLALARLQRKFRINESPYRTPQTLAGGPRLDAALMAASGRTATTKAMGQGSTQHQHLKETEASPRLLETWLKRAAAGGPSGTIRAELRAAVGGSDIVELSLLDGSRKKRANIVCSVLKDRRGRTLLSVLELNVFDKSLEGTPCLVLAQLFLIHRYGAAAVHYLSPTEAEARLSGDMKERGFFLSVVTAAPQVTIADVNTARVRELLHTGEIEHFLEAVGQKA